MGSVFGTHAVDSTLGDFSALAPRHRDELDRRTEVLSYGIDLRGVATRDDFQRELARHFPLGPDHRDLWPSLYEAIMYQTGPLHLRFLGWAEFQARMPRYARRLRRLLTDYQRLRGTERLTIEDA
jgi:hypothetical protein